MMIVSGMKFNLRIAAFSTLASFFAANAYAAPYQFEVDAGFDRTKFEIKSNGRESETDDTGGSLTYYLQIVDFQSGPLAERAFLDKSAYITGSFEQSKPEDGGEKTETFGVDGRFVTDTDLIIELGYQTSDDGSDSDETTTTVGFGKYLDGQTTAVLSYEKESDIFDVTTITGTYRTLIINESTGTALGTQLSLSHIDTESDSGYSVRGIGAYYLSDPMAIGATLSYRKIGDDDTTGYGLLGNYFFTETIFATASYLVANNDNFDSTVINLGLGARF